MPFTVYACACSGFQGRAPCGSDGRLGGCDCSVPVDAGTELCDVPTSWYPDLDGDGHGAGLPTSACTQPAGHSPLGDDCDDEDPRAFGGQTAFFSSPRKNGSFDFDCDGKSTRESEEIGQARCQFSGTTCIGGSTKNYWQGFNLPECGQEASWVKSCSASCVADVEVRKQGCR